MPFDHNKLRWLKRIGKYTALIEDAILSMMVSVMVIIAAAQILLRNFFEIGLSWGDPLLRALVLWIGLLGAIVASRTENHITIDIISRYLSPKLKIFSKIVTDLFTIAVCVVLSYYSVMLVKLDYEAKVIAFADVPAWVIELIIPIGFAVIAIRYFEALGRILIETWFPEEKA